jgi:hypothetical protein
LHHDDQTGAEKHGKERHHLLFAQEIKEAPHSLIDRRPTTDGPRIAEHKVRQSEAPDIDGEDAEQGHAAQHIDGDDTLTGADWSEYGRSSPQHFALDVEDGFRGHDSLPLGLLRNRGIKVNHLHLMCVNIV